MNKFYRVVVAGTILVITANAVIFLNRNNGFEYIKYSGIKDLYPDNPPAPFISKWNRYNERFSISELKEGEMLLKRFAGIDSLDSTQQKIIAIGSWIHRTFYRRVGAPSDSLSNLSHPLQQYKLLVEDSSQRLWCSQYRSLFGFFCTAAGIKNRYIDAVPVDSMYAGYHGLNEAYLPELKIWVMADVTRNILLLKDRQSFLSAAGYYQYRTQDKSDTLTLFQGTDSSYQVSLYPRVINAKDGYFNKGYMLRYYYSIHLPAVYSAVNKFRRYVIADPWYENYDPVRQHSNLLFRVKQFFFWVMVAALGSTLILVFRKRKKPAK